MAFVEFPKQRLLAAIVAFATHPAGVAQQVKEAATPDITGHFTAPVAGNDYVRREVMIPMRDGIKLYTVLLIPKGASNAPIVLTRTPYNATKRATRNISPHILASVPQADE